MSKKKNPPPEAAKKETTIMEWYELIKEARRTRSILIDNNKTEAVRFTLAPILDQVDRGAKNPTTKMRLHQAIVYLQETYYTLFFPERFETQKLTDVSKEKGDEPNA